MRLILALASVAVLALASSADAQVFPRRSTGPQYQQQNCPGGVCPAVPGVPSAGGFQSLPVQPSANHELWLENGQLVWKLKPGASIPQVMPVATADADPVPPDVLALYRPKVKVVAVAAEPLMHGPATYKLARRLAERSLTDEVGKKGYRVIEARTKARELVADLDDHTIDVVGKRMAGLKEGIPDSLVGDRIDNIIRLVEALVKMLLIFL